MRVLAERQRSLVDYRFERFYPELGKSILLCCTEMTRRGDMDAVAEAFGA